MPKTTDKSTALTTTETTLATPAPAGAVLVPREAIASDPLGALAFFAGQVKKTTVFCVTMQALAGMAAKAAKTALAVTQGKRNDLANDPRLADGWDGFCKDTLGVSKSTVQRWTLLAEYVAAKLGKLDWLTAQGMEQFASLSDDQFSALQKAIKAAIPDGQSMTQMLLEYGVLKGGSKKATKPGTPGEDEAPDPNAPPPGYSVEEWQQWLNADATEQSAIDHARAYLAALRAWSDGAKHLPHIPQNYRDDIEEAREIADAGEKQFSAKI